MPCGLSLRRLQPVVIGTLLGTIFTGILAAQASPGKTDTTPAGESQEAYVFEHISNRIRFEDDGTGVRDTSAVIRIQSQAAIQAFGQLIFGYSSATEEIEVSYVRVRKPDGRTVETPATNAQDFAPDVLREAPMYSDYRQRHISVVDLQPGDVLEYRTIVHVTKPLAQHEFWYEHTFPKEVVVRDQKLEIDVPKLREVKLKSPKQKYDTREEGDRRIYTWTIANFIPKRKHDDDDDDDDDDIQPDVQITTFTNWQRVAHWYAKLQGDRVVVDDAVKKKAVELTKGATTPVEKAHRLYDYVARNIRYVSISFGVGRLQPHAAAEVLQSGYGDCKDKHTLLQALLQAEGIQSYPILINSSRKIDVDVPSPGQFDHLITAAKLGPELTWLDATAEVAPYGLILYQLRNKQALLASDDAAAGLHLTPADAPVKNRVVMKMNGKFSENGALDLQMDLTAQGDSDFPLRSVFRRISQSRWEDMLKYLSSTWGFAGDVSDIHIDSLEDTTKPFHLTYHYRNEDYFRVPNSGTDFRLLPPAGVRRVGNASGKKATEPLDVGPAGEHLYQIHVEFPANYSVRVAPAVKMSRDYGEYSTTYTLNKNVLDAERRMVLKVNELPASRRSDYESFRNVTSSQLEQALSCSIAPASATAAATAAKLDDTPEAMQKAATTAMQRREYSRAVDLLKTVVAKDPQRKDAWDQLGLAYSGMNQHDDAIAAFRKQIELDAFHNSAHSDLAGELQETGKLEDAAAAYRKQLEITPYDKLTHKNLGLLLVKMKHDTEARMELEAAAAIPPDDPAVTVALAQVYSRTGDTEKSAALMKGVLGAASSPAGSDVFAAALGDNLDANETLRSARKTLDDIGEQFDSGEYDKLGPQAFSAMNLVALAWARIGWAKFQQNELLDAMQFLNASWVLSQSGTVGNRLGQVLEKEGQKEKARHMFALAAAAGGADAKSSHDHAVKLAVSAGDAEKEIGQAATELVQTRTVKVTGLAGVQGTAQFAMVFEASNTPDRMEYLEGDAALRSASEKFRTKVFPVKFPDVSSVKIVRKGALSCSGTECSLVLAPLE